MLYRLIYTLATVIGLFFLPWWFLVIAIIPGLVLFSFYIEGILPLLLLDLLYAPVETGFFTTQFLFTISGLGLLLIIEYFRPRLLMLMYN